MYTGGTAAQGVSRGDEDHTQFPPLAEPLHTTHKHTTPHKTSYM